MEVKDLLVLLDDDYDDDYDDIEKVIEFSNWRCVGVEMHI